MRKTRLSLLFVILILSFIIFLIIQNNSIVITKANYYNPKIPADFDGFRIAHISDLHNKMFGEDQAELLNKVTNLSPDIIVVTGDLIDRRKYDLDSAMTFISGAVKIAPVYYVSGNHEAWSGKFPLIKERLLDAGVRILDHTAVELSKGKSSIQITGLADPDFLTSHYFEGKSLVKSQNNYTGGQQMKILKFYSRTDPSFLTCIVKTIWTWFCRACSWRTNQDTVYWRLGCARQGLFQNIQAAVIVKIQRQCL